MNEVKSILSIENKVRERTVHESATIMEIPAHSKVISPSVEVTDPEPDLERF